MFFSGTHAPPAPHNSIPDEPAVVALVDRAVASRDQSAFGEIYDLYLDRVYRYLYYRTGNHADAEDLTEQTFLKAWQAINRFRWQGRPFMAWLYRLAHNVLVDHQRVRRPTVSLQEEDQPRDIASEASVQALAQRLDADMLSNAVRQLTAEQQQVIILKFIDGLDNADVAQIMEKREGAIRALQLRALLSLRRVLEAQGERA